MQSRAQHDVPTASVSSVFAGSAASPSAWSTSWSTSSVPGSLSDDPKKIGRPTDFTVTVRRVQINAGAGFLVVLTGDIFRMPGLPRVPAAAGIDLLPDGTITGVE